MTDQPNQPDGGVIQPVGFKPTQQAQARRGPLRPWQVVLIAIGLVVAFVLWFLFTAKSVQLQLTPAPQQVAVDGGIAIELGGVLLLREGTYRVSAELPGYYPMDATLAVGSPRSQSHSFEFRPLPGRIALQSQPLLVLGSQIPQHTLAGMAHW